MDQPIVTAPVLKFHVLDTGFCTARENHMMTGGRRVTVPVHSIAVLLRHPDRGWFLFDTGYAPRILHATRRLPFRIYRWATPMTVSPELSLVHRLRQLGITPDDIPLIVLSHFHADHVAGILDFPTSRFVASREAWTAVRDLLSFRALTRAFIPALIPADFETRASLVDRFDGPEVPPFGGSHDLFADGSALLIRLPGHARGQVGMLARTDTGRVLFAADSFFMRAAIRGVTMPHPITRVAGVDDWAALGTTVGLLAEFSRANPDVELIATHCPEAFAKHARPAP